MYDNLISGEIYKTNDVIFKCKSGQYGTGFRISCKTFVNGNNWSFQDIPKLANQFEIDWLHSCIKAKNFVPQAKQEYQQYEIY